MRAGVLVAVAAAAMLAAGAGTAAAQDRRAAIEGTVGWAGFVDDATIHHRLFGGSMRVPLSRRLSVGPEIVYARGPAGDRDLFVLGSLWIDLVPDAADSPVVPYVVMGGGYMRHTDRFLSGTFTTGEGSFTAGGGARAALSDRVYVGGDVRIGWELHLRATAHVGVRLGAP